MVLLSTLMYIGVALVILLFMITVHEFGHYIAGKLFGFKINEFAIGFGKPIFKRVSKRTGEVFSIRWIPLGGYCAFAGDDAAAGEGGSRAEADKRAFDNKSLGENAAPEPKGIDFNKQPPWKRLIVLFAGAFFNFLCAIVFSVVLLMIAGYYQAVGFKSVVNETYDGSVNQNATLLTNSSHGDVEFIYAIGTSEGNLKKFTLLKSFNSILAQYNESDTLVFRVKYADGTVANVGGFKLVQLKDNNGGAFSGIGINSPFLKWQPMGFFDAVAFGTRFCFEVAWMILCFLWLLVSGKVNFFSNVGGPIATVSMMSEMVSNGLLNIFVLVPLISVNLALFNLLPIPALDGARMVFVGIEWARGKPINPEIEGRIHMIGLFLLLALVFIADVGFIFGGSGRFLLYCKLLF